MCIRLLVGSNIREYLIAIGHLTLDGVIISIEDYLGLILENDLYHVVVEPEQVSLIGLHPFPDKLKVIIAEIGVIEVARG